MAALTNLPSKLSRALGAYLVSVGIDQRQVFPKYTGKDRTFAYGPIVTTLVLPGKPNPRLTGNWKFPVALQIKGTLVSDGTAAAKEAQRVAFDAFVGEVNQAMMSSDDDTTLKATVELINEAGRAMAVAGTSDEEDAKEDWCKAENNADMADFTITELEDSTFGGGEASDCNWEVVMMFDATACESNVD
jgi:hypothetical protein